MRSHDGLAYIGHNPLDADNVLVATGDSGNGLTHGAIAGVLLAATIQGEAHPFARLYDPSRVTLRAGVELIRQNLDAIQQYAHWVEAGDVADEGQIPPGQGAVVRDGVRLLAVYRDLRGGIHRCSAVCPHLGGVVQFNTAEASWDCPCHGSRFDALGHVIRGPANVDLLRHRESHAEPAREQEAVPEPLFGVLPST
jgi:Rieske Fe-S protein